MLSFHHSTSHATSLFFLMYMDVWGPYYVPTNHACKFFVTMIDDFNRATWIFLLTTKQDVFHKFKQFFTYVQTQFKYVIQTIRTNHGSEFHNRSFATYLSQMGISHQTSCTYTSQHNARVERKHKNL